MSLLKNDHSNRLAILKELVKSAQSIDDDISSSMGEFIPYSDDQFGHHKVFMEDYNTKFSPTDINQAIEMSNKSDWITIPEFANFESLRDGLIPFTTTSPGAVAAGTIKPPGHMQKENTPRSSPITFA